MNRYFVYYDNKFLNSFENSDKALAYIKEYIGHIRARGYPEYLDSFDIIEGKLLKVFDEIKFEDIETYNKLESIG